MGAWIETYLCNFGFCANPQSHPVWVRGLKHLHFLCLLSVKLVAPCMGAWIETTSKGMNHRST